MIIPAISYVCEHPCAGSALLAHDSSQAVATAVVVTEPQPGIPWAVLTGVVVAEHESEKAIATGIVQGASRLALDIVNADLRDEPVSHEHIEYP